MINFPKTMECPIAREKRYYEMYEERFGKGPKKFLKAPTDQEVLQLLDELSDLMPPRMLVYWLGTPNSAFGNRKPSDMIYYGDIEEIKTMIKELDYGVCY